tara:strand:+ start:3109 stop:3339 length:231 start_codon:yes stop_codon:yes gene_type:complete
MKKKLHRADQIVENLKEQFGTLNDLSAEKSFELLELLQKQETFNLWLLAKSNIKFVSDLAQIVKEDRENKKAKEIA